MGSWSVTIQGNGPHHNDKPFDIERKVEAFVEDLKASHTVRAADLTIGSRFELDFTKEKLPPLPVKEPAPEEVEEQPTLPPAGGDGTDAANATGGTNEEQPPPLS